VLEKLLVIPPNDNSLDNFYAVVSELADNLWRVKV